VRAPQSDKRASGAPLVIAGSRQFPGAAVLCAMGAARAGAGYVTVATTSDAAPTLRAHLVEQVVVEYSTDDVARAINELSDLTNHCSSVALGPGLGLGDATGEIVRGFVERCTLPIVGDAGALFHLAKNLEILRGKQCVLTPHEGEFARLFDSAGDKLTRTRAAARRSKAVVLLKGSDTVIAAADGRAIVNANAPPTLATAGAGDVLSGIVLGLLAQGMDTFLAAAAAVWFHGAAATAFGPGLLAEDLPDLLPKVMAACAAPGNEGM
jgi:NAD(P)H-hydrate epimerase